MRSDTQLQQDVMTQFKADAILYSAEIGVTAYNGMITLSGFVDNYDEKLEAAELARRVLGVKSVFDRLEVIHDSEFTKNDDIVEFSRSAPINF